MRLKRMTLPSCRATLMDVSRTSDSDLSQIAARLHELRQEHRDLDLAITRLQADIQADELALKRLKKRKLQLKDSISRYESALIPDEPA